MACMNEYPFTINKMQIIPSTLVWRTSEFTRVMFMCINEGQLKRIIAYSKEVAMPKVHTPIWVVTLKI